MTGRVCVVGSFMMDIVVRTPRRPAPGETVIGDSVEFFLGGKGFNQAVAAARHGAPTAMVGRLGADAFGDQFIDALEREGIDATHVGRDPSVGTGTGLPVVDATGQNAIVVVPQANTSCGVNSIEAAARLIEESDVLLVQLELPIDTVRRALEIARAAGVHTVLNPAPMHAEVRQLAGLVDLVVPNEAEAAAVVAATTGAAPGPDDAEVAAAVADALDADSVLLTLGERGALLRHHGRSTLVPAPVVDVVDTVGAGDAACGVLAAALASGASLEDAVRRGTAAGSLAVTVPGAEPSMPTAAAVEAILARAEAVPGGGR